MNFDLDFAVRNFAQALYGIPTTLLITFVAVLFGLPLAFFIAQARIKQIKGLSQLLTLYISFLRGTPMIVQIFLIYNGLPVIIEKVAAGFSLDVDVYSINPLFYAFIIFILNASAGFSEMWKSALSSVPKGQLEAAETSGLTEFQAFSQIIIPQALVAAAPSLCSTTLNMLKNTSLVFIMTVMDVTARARVAAGVEYKYLEGYLDIFITYLIVCTILEVVFKKWEKHISAYKFDSEKIKTAYKPDKKRKPEVATVD